MRDAAGSSGRPRLARRARVRLEAPALLADRGELALEREDVADARASRGVVGKRAGGAPWGGRAA